MEPWVTQFIGTIGIPGAMCFYIMTTMRKSIDANTRAITILGAKLGVDVSNVPNS